MCVCVCVLFLFCFYQIPIDELVELTNFQESPRFPHHIVLDSGMLLFFLLKKKFS